MGVDLFGEILRKPASDSRSVGSAGDGHEHVAARRKHKAAAERRFEPVVCIAEQLAFAEAVYLFGNGYSAAYIYPFSATVFTAVSGIAYTIP